VRITDLAGIYHSCIAALERTLRMRYGVVTMAYVMMHVMIAVVDMMSRTE
jgi:hypothetical protein